MSIQPFVNGPSVVHLSDANVLSLMLLLLLLLLPSLLCWVRTMDQVLPQQCLLLSLSYVGPSHVLLLRARNRKGAHEENTSVGYMNRPMLRCTFPLTRSCLQIVTKWL